MTFPTVVRREGMPSKKWLSDVCAEFNMHYGTAYRPSDSMLLGRIVFSSGRSNDSLPVFLGLLIEAGCTIEDSAPWNPATAKSGYIRIARVPKKPLPQEAPNV